MEKNPKKRFTSLDIKNSLWFKTMSINFPGIDFQEKNLKAKDKIINKIKDLGFPIEAVKTTIEKKKLNHIYSTFCLLKNKFCC